MSCEVLRHTLISCHYCVQYHFSKDLTMGMGTIIVKVLNHSLLPVYSWKNYAQEILFFFDRMIRLWEFQATVFNITSAHLQPFATKPISIKFAHNYVWISTQGPFG